MKTQTNLGPCIHTPSQYYIDKDGYPIVMAGGIYSNLDEWKDFGSELANEGFEVYLIELTGGPDAEADNAYDYTYEHLSDNVFPDYINTIINDSGNNKLKYVGHSNGCRVALTGINDNGFRNNFETFVGLGCPVLLNEMSGAGVQVNELRIIGFDGESMIGTPVGHIAIQELESKNITHIYKQDYGYRLVNGVHQDIGVFFLGTSDYKISLNLQDFYNDLYIENNSQVDLNSVADKHIWFAGQKGYGQYPLGLKSFDDDGAVPIADMRYLNDTLDNSNLYLEDFNHVKLIKKAKVLNKVMEELK